MSELIINVLFDDKKKISDFGFLMNQKSDFEKVKSLMNFVFRK